MVRHLWWWSKQVQLTHSYTRAHCNSYANTYTDTDYYTHAHCNSNTNSHSDTNGNQHTNRQPNPNLYAHAHQHANNYTDGDAYDYSNSNPHTYPHLLMETVPATDLQGDTVAVSAIYRPVTLNPGLNE